MKDPLPEETERQNREHQHKCATRHHVTQSALSSALAVDATFKPQKKNLKHTKSDFNILFHDEAAPKVQTKPRTESENRVIMSMNYKPDNSQSKLLRRSGGQNNQMVSRAMGPILAAAPTVERKSRN